ncbi:uncharacterized protein LY89DRAFT_776583 [Mollisia scopiformis]|uniref:Uncharacterized protein n=1 Tax=Mollisia scopiformis TaxID=149040 RepID=A0A194XWR1_MOLSC|nr:uncharacterized protein LY89DRAFT_776583 [Mollisia scopiformis]KUJ24469.1 hypothetical protein LY89DRAFT_776583 [Mollisia scopiformis]
MRPQYLLLLPLTNTAAHLINPNVLELRTPTWPEDPSAAPPTTTSPAQILQQCAACQVLGSALAICANITPSFTALQPTAQAKCLCYSSTIWSPNIFDNAVESCANYASTAAPPAYSALSNLENFCADVGDVEKPVTVFTLAPTGNGGPTSGSGYVASPSPAMTGYGATNTAGANTSPASTSGNAGGQGSSPSKTTAATGITITVGGSGSTGTARTGVARRVIPRENVVWIGFAISLLFLFL